VVHDSLTGRALTTVRLPGTLTQGRQVVAEAGSDHTFAVLATGGRRGQAVNEVLKFRVTAAGRVADLTASPVPVPPRAAVYSIALSPDGGRVALDLYRSFSGRRLPVEEIEVASLATAEARTWTHHGVQGMLSDLSWTEGGRYLGFLWLPERTPWDKASQVRLLDTAAPGSNLLASRVIATGRGSGIGQLQDALLTANGRRVIAVALRLCGSPGCRVVPTLAELSVPGGHVVRILPEGEEPQFCNILSVTGDGRHVLLQCPQFERIDNGRVTRLPPTGKNSAAAW
jgi:hypothetical protein